MTYDVGHAAHLAERFRRMVAQAAWRSWRRLPAHTRVWVSIEDMIEDGMWYVISEGVPKWSVERGSMSTFLHTCIGNFFNEHYYYKLVVSEKRNERRILSLDQLAAKHRDLSRERAIELELGKRHDYRSAERMEKDCFVVPLMMQVYRLASENLQEEIRHWFLREGSERLLVKTTKFYLASGEFRELAKRTGLGIEDCRHLFCSPGCLDELSRGIRWVPFDLNNPTPKLASSV